MHWMDPSPATGGEVIECPADLSHQTPHLLACHSPARPLLCPRRLHGEPPYTAHDACSAERSLVSANGGSGAILSVGLLRVAPPEVRGGRRCRSVAVQSCRLKHLRFLCIL